VGKKIKFIDLFAGIGGFHLAFHRCGAECVFASEKDKHARWAYEANHKKISPHLFSKKGLFNDDILKIGPEKVPNHEVLCAGFPCQPFSQAGYKRGFMESHEDRGNMFFIITKIIHAKRPKAFFLENVRHLENHDGGKTFSIIKKVLEDDLKYNITYKIIKASDYGLPQHRPRIFIVGFRKEDHYPINFLFPEPVPLRFTMDDVWGGKCNKTIGFTLRVGGRSSSIRDRRNWDSYLVNGKVRQLGPYEGLKMMGFPQDFIMPRAKVASMKLLGNSVAVDAVYYTAKAIINHLGLKGAQGKLVINREKGVFEFSV
jgi:DNA (cytosine-5)-methyltransferase 1